MIEGMQRDCGFTYKLNHTYDNLTKRGHDPEGVTDEKYTRNRQAHSLITIRYESRNKLA